IEIIYARSQAFFKAGLLDSAYIYRIRYENMVDTLQYRQQNLEVLKLSALTEAGIAQSRYMADIYYRNMIIAIICVIFIVIGSGILIFFNRRILHQKIKAMESEMALEKSRRHITATSVNLQEKDNVLGILKEELSEMRKKGTVDDTDALRLESTIKAHLSEKESDELFADVYGVITPAFATHLQERCGELADSYIKLASYILIGLDNKKIARLMNIKPESVRQSRWRLRQKLNLKDDETMEDILQQMNK
ncbi:MAG: LuxR C-terminal-related transcriptional regulator, partial [Muribaculaceae bacterium]|nr:LuxR C-terminal-related transcriptional regulator [Muribaculaceae bacterium]